MSPPGPTGSPTPSPLGLLMRVNLRQGWRRLIGVREQSRLLTALILLFLSGYCLLSFSLFRLGLRFAGSFPGLGGVLIDRMLYLLFAFLFVLLLLSNLVICYTNLFRNRETEFLLPLPVAPTTIFQWKFIESAVLASWAFLFLIAPLLAAYGLNQGARWHFYVVTGGLIALFIILPALAGAWVAVNLARHLDRRAFQLAAGGAALVLMTAAVSWLQPEALSDEQLDTRVLVVLDRLMQKTRFAHFPLLPSYWLSAGVQQWAEGALKGAVFFSLVLLSHVLFFGALGLTRMGPSFYEGTSTVQSRGSMFARWSWFQAWQERRRRRACQTGLTERLARLLLGVPVDVRALLVKDLRVFWRDTTQWGQTLVLFGLLAVYIINLRHFSQQLTSAFWIYLVSYLNLGACSLNLATLTTRFVYPQFSLEGKRLWIVGLAPLGLPRVILGKFLFASLASLTLTVGLLLLSCYMLKLPTERMTYLTVAIGIMSFVLNGLAVGLGVLYPNLKEDNPSRIVSGFGGTFCLVVSFLYILASVVLLAIGSPWTRRGYQPWWITLSCWTGFAVLSMVVGWLPLRAGLRQVTRFEY